ncbi:hypothetical protein ZWY2020_053098 [Hordeum vulgare]|nr:hypothetical protein ZWY2020_053098 [Hordeum vulgare]
MRGLSGLGGSRRCSHFSPPARGPRRLPPSSASAASFRPAALPSAPPPRRPLACPSGLLPLPPPPLPPRASPTLVHPSEISSPFERVCRRRVGSDGLLPPQIRERSCGWIPSPPLVCAHGGDSTNAFPNTVGARSP